MRVWGMHERTQIKLSAPDRAALKAVVANRNSPQKHVWRAKIVLLTAAGHGTAEIMRRTGKAKTVIWRWQERFGSEGAAGAVARQDATVAHPAIELRYCRTRGGLDLGWPARARDPLDGRGHGQSGRDQR